MEKTFNVWRAIKSVIAAMLGIQSQANRENDFTNGKPIVFAVLGVVFTLLFIGALLLVVSFVLP